MDDNDPLETGLRYRLKRAERQIAAQHRHLKPIFAELWEALARRDGGAVAAAFARYQEALDAHFALEERFFFPALHGLLAETVTALETLSLEHIDFLEALEGIASRIGAGELAEAERALAAFASTLQEHEKREERLVRVDPARPRDLGTGSA